MIFHICCFSKPLPHAVGRHYCKALWKYLKFQNLQTRILKNKNLDGHSELSTYYNTLNRGHSMKLQFSIFPRSDEE